MYVVLILILVAIAGAGIAIMRLLLWAAEETCEQSLGHPETAPIFSRLFPRRTPLLSYRRDKRGRFRKMR